MNKYLNKIKNKKYTVVYIQLHQPPIYMNTLTNTLKQPSNKSYPSFSQIPPGRNPANYVLINGRYFFNDYDTTGNYLRSQFLR